MKGDSSATLLGEVRRFARKSLGQYLLLGPVVCRCPFLCKVCATYGLRILVALHPMPLGRERHLVDHTLLRFFLLVFFLVLLVLLVLPVLLFFLLLLVIVV